MGKPLSPPILPGNVCFPEDFHSDWGKTLKKFETKFQRKVNEYLPSLIESVDSAIMKKQNENFEKVIFSVVDTSPGQKRRAEAIFLRFYSRMEHVPLQGSRQRRHLPSSSASGSSDNFFSTWTWIFWTALFRATLSLKREIILSLPNAQCLYFECLYFTRSSCSDISSPLSKKYLLTPS